MDIYILTNRGVRFAPVIRGVYQSVMHGRYNVYIGSSRVS